MSDASDTELLEQFARKDSEAAFALLVERHVSLVHSVALRHTESPEHAQDITQAVFIVLARKARGLGHKTVLPGWLYNTARLTAANFQRAEARRLRREQEAFMESTLEETAPEPLWDELGPVLDEAMAHLGAMDRDALVLRYFQNKTLPEMGAALGIEERAAQKRVMRALEKLRKIFAKRGIVSTATLLAGAISAHSVQAAPVALANTITAVAVTKSAAAGSSTLTLVKGALKIMAWTKAKATIVVGAGVLLLGGTAPVVWHYQKSSVVNRNSDPEAWRSRFEATYKLEPGENLKHIAPPFIPERAEYYRREWSVQARHDPAPPASFRFFIQGNSHIQYCSATSDGVAFMRLIDLSEPLLGIRMQHLEGPTNVLDLALDGDWVIRAGTDRETLLKAWLAIIRKETGRSIQIAPRMVEREVIVTRGTYTPSFRSKTITGNRPQIDLYAEKKDGQGGLGGGDAREFFEWLGDWLDVRFVNEVAASDQPVRFDWRIHGDSCYWNMGARREEMTEKLLKNVADQTGFSFNREPRMVEVWFATEKP